MDTQDVALVIWDPPAAPTASRGLPSLSVKMAGDIEDKGLLPIKSKGGLILCLFCHTNVQICLFGYRANAR